MAVNETKRGGTVSGSERANNGTSRPGNSRGSKDGNLRALVVWKTQTIPNSEKPKT